MAAMPFPCNAVLLIQGNLPRVFPVFTLYFSLSCNSTQTIIRCLQLNKNYKKKELLWPRILKFSPPTQSLFWYQTLSFNVTEAFSHLSLSQCSLAPFSSVYTNTILCFSIWIADLYTIQIPPYNSCKKQTS